MGVTAPDLLRQMARKVIEADRTMKSHGLSGLAYWATGAEAVRAAAGHAPAALPTNIRETGFMWPADKSFPWTAEECKAAVIGYQVKWRGDFDDFLTHLRGKWETIDGYVGPHQS